MGDAECRSRTESVRTFATSPAPRWRRFTTVGGVSAPGVRPGQDVLKKEGRGWRFYTACTIGLLALIIVLQNTESTTVTILFAETEMPLIFALVVAILIGVAIGWLTPKVRGSKRHERP